ncbi:unnamed protein product [Mucor hiemalis]
MQEGQHPLTINSPSLLSVEDEDIRKSPNNRRRRRGSRRRSVASEVNENALLPPRRKSLTSTTAAKDSPAFHSLVDMISEMKRLPSISITTTDKQAATEPVQDEWKRVRRHSKPHRK